MHSSINIFKYCFSNQLNWLKDDNGNLIKIDKILRYEKDEYDDLFKNILKLSDYNIEIMVHPTKHKHYSYYYNDESIKLVTKYYKEDLEFFKYDF